MVLALCSTTVPHCDLPSPSLPSGEARALWETQRTEIHRAQVARSQLDGLMVPNPEPKELPVISPFILSL